MNIDIGYFYIQYENEAVTNVAVHKKKVCY